MIRSKSQMTKLGLALISFTSFMMTASFSTLAEAAPQPFEAICRPTTSLARPVRVGWDSLVAIDNVMFDGKVLKLATRFESAIDGLEKAATDYYVPVELGGALSLGTLASVGPRELYLSSVQFGVREIAAPYSAGPTAPGAYKATATLILVSEFRKAPSADLQFTTTQVELTCAYTVKP